MPTLKFIKNMLYPHLKYNVPISMCIFFIHKINVLFFKHKVILKLDIDMSIFFTCIINRHFYELSIY